MYELAKEIFIYHRHWHQVIKFENFYNGMSSMKPQLNHGGYSLKLSIMI